MNIKQRFQQIEKRIRNLEKKKLALISARNRFGLRLGKITAVENEKFTVQEETVDGIPLWKFKGCSQLSTDKNALRVGDIVAFTIDSAGNRYMLPSGNGLITIQQGGTKANTVIVTETGSTQTIETGKPLFFFEDTSFFHEETRSSDNQRKYMGSKIPDTQSKACHVQGFGDEVATLETTGTATDDFKLTVSVGVDAQGNITSIDSEFDDNEFCACSLTADIAFLDTSQGDVFTFVIKSGGNLPPCFWSRNTGIPFGEVFLRNGSGSETGLWIITDSLFSPTFTYTGPLVSESVNGDYTCIRSSTGLVKVGDSAFVVNAESCP